MEKSDENGLGRLLIKSMQCMRKCQTKLKKLVTSLYHMVGTDWKESLRPNPELILDYNTINYYFLKICKKERRKI
jgi:hypothetical protein